MAKQAGYPKRPNQNRNLAVPKKVEPDEIEEISPENVEILRETLGIDVTKESPERVRQIVAMRASISSSPYPSAGMLADYVNRGFADMVPKITAVIDDQRNHRMALEKEKTKSAERRLNTGQWGAMLMGFFGIAGALIAGYFHVPVWICVVVALISVGGPNVATIISRIVGGTAKATRS